MKIIIIINKKKYTKLLRLLEQPIPPLPKKTVPAIIVERRSPGLLYIDSRFNYFNVIVTAAWRSPAGTSTELPSTEADAPFADAISPMPCSVTLNALPLP